MNREQLAGIDQLLAVLRDGKATAAMQQRAARLWRKWKVADIDGLLAALRKGAATVEMQRRVYDSMVECRPPVGRPPKQKDDYAHVGEVEFLTDALGGSRKGRRQRALNYLAGRNGVDGETQKTYFKRAKKALTLTEDEKLAIILETFGSIQGVVAFGYLAPTRRRVVTTIQ